MDQATLDNAVVSVVVLGGGAAFNYPQALANTRRVIRLFLVDSGQPPPHKRKAQETEGVFQATGKFFFSRLILLWAFYQPFIINSR